MTKMWNRWCDCLPVMSSQSIGGVPRLKHWCFGSDADFKRSAKAGLDALFLLLHFFLKHPCKYFSVLQKFVQFYWEGKFCYIFLKKERLTGAPETWNVFFCCCCCFKIKVYDSLLFAEYQSYIFENHTCSLLMSSFRWHLHIPPAPW